jgi:chemotaxis protein histidine kinase CheA
MLLATDVTEQRRLERAVEEQEEEHARSMAAMRRLLAGGAHLFVSFTERAREQIGTCLAELGTTPREMNRAELDAVFRRAHTMKSEARAFDLRGLEAQLGFAEDLLATLRDAAHASGVTFTGETHARLLDALQRSDDAVLGAREDFVSVSPVGRAALDQMAVQRSDVEELVALVSGEEGAIARAVERLAARRFGESTATLADMVPAWAARENKQVNLDIDGRDVRVPPGLARILGGVLVHLVRNAIAHGVETPLERTREGKQPFATVKVAATDGSGGPTIMVEDDGRGLDDAQILARARALGLDDTAPPSELVFAPGLSTRDGADALAGRGVGLDAVREDLGGAGYGIRVESAAGKGTRYVVSARE